MQNNFSNITKYFPNQTILSIYDYMANQSCNQDVVVVIDDWIAFQYIKISPYVHYVIRTSWEDFVEWHRMLRCSQSMDNPIGVLITNDEGLKYSDWGQLNEFVKRISDNVIVRILNMPSLA